MRICRVPVGLDALAGLLAHDTDYGMTIVFGKKVVVGDRDVG